MATLKDVAERAGVSTATVSHVLNETRFVSEELRQRVYQTIEELNYRPDAIARSLRRRKTRNIGMIVPDISYPFLAEVARGVGSAGLELGYNVILCDSDGDLEREAEYIELLQEKKADGIVFVAASESSGHVQALIEQEMPVVVCDRELPGMEVDTVIADNVGSGYQATEHLIELGHRRIGCIAGPQVLEVSTKRVEGYKRALEQHGIPLSEELVVRGNFRSRGGYEAMWELLALDEPPTAVFACNDLMAIGAICAASQKRLRIPQDVAIVGCDDIALASFTNPSLTTVAQPKHEMGTAAVEMLVERIRDKSRPPTRRLLPTELVLRDSC
ncbi:MAG: LacI family DNA-binding transcriptional regulator [Anaerolineales bacterium]|nr:LacI family DNA-binding transcriptional regulator [Anaerolineales bacterium]